MTESEATEMTATPRIIARIFAKDNHKLQMTISVNQFDIAKVYGNTVTVLESTIDGIFKRTILMNGGQDIGDEPYFQNIQFIMLGNDVKLLESKMLENGEVQIYGIKEGQDE